MIAIAARSLWPPFDTLANGAQVAIRVRSMRPEHLPRRVIIFNPSERLVQNEIAYGFVVNYKPSRCTPTLLQFASLA